MVNKLKLSEYVTIAVIVPETHAVHIREAITGAGGGETPHYSHGSFSVKGISRFMPKEGAKECRRNRCGRTDRNNVPSRSARASDRRN